MSVHSLKPWTELVKLRPDVESGSLAEAVFAIDLGAIATGPRCRRPRSPMIDPHMTIANRHINCRAEQDWAAPHSGTRDRGCLTGRRAVL